MVKRIYIKYIKPGNGGLKPSWLMCPNINYTTQIVLGVQNRNNAEGWSSSRIKHFFSCTCIPTYIPHMAHLRIYHEEHTPAVGICAGKNPPKGSSSWVLPCIWVTQVALPAGLHAWLHMPGRGLFSGSPPGALLIPKHLHWYLWKHTHLHQYEIYIWKLYICYPIF